MLQPNPQIVPPCDHRQQGRAPKGDQPDGMRQVGIPLARHGELYQMQDVQPTYTEWADVETSLREGRAPDPSEIISELQLKFAPKGKATAKVFQC